MTKQPLRIVFVSKFGPPGYSGAGRAMFALAQRMKAMGVADPFFLSARLSSVLARKEETSGVRIRRLPMLAFSTLMSHISFHVSCAVWLLVNRKHYDLIQITGISHALLPIILVARIFRKPILLRTSLYGSDDLQTIGEGAFGSLRLRWIMMTQGVIAISERIAEVSRPYVRSGSFLRLVPNFVDPSMFHPAGGSAERRVLRAQLGLPIEGPLVLFCGSVRKRKGVDLLIEAWGHVRGRHDGAILCFLGPRSVERSGDTNDEFSIWLDRRVEELGVEDSVFFAGKQGTSIPLYYRTADVFVLPSRHEGMPNAVLEAMASAVPVIVCAQPWLPDDFVKDGKWGFVVDPEPEALAGAIVRVLSSSSGARRMGEDGRKEVLKNYGPELAVKRYLSVYSDVGCRGPRL